jgi:hypothetical protein
MLTVVRGFQLRGWDVSAAFVEAAMVEPVDPFQSGDFHVPDGAPRALGFDQFDLVQAVDRLGEGVVVAIPGGTDRGVNAGVEEPFCERDRCVLRAPIVAKPKSDLPREFRTAVSVFS